MANSCTRHVPYHWFCANKFLSEIAQTSGAGDSICGTRVGLGSFRRDRHAWRLLPVARSRRPGRLTCGIPGC